jgi:hypothetical protein
VDGEKVLIECALGARWGFYKFPPDPADDDPVGGGRLNWRDFELEPVWTDAELSSCESQYASLRFDLSLPLPAQLASAKRLLQIEQRRRIKLGLVRTPKISVHAARLCRMLRLLDALEAKAGEEQIQKLIYPHKAQIDSDEADEASRLRDRDYRRLLLLAAL